VRGVATVRGVAHVRGEAQGRGVAGGRAPDMGLAGVVASFLSRVARLSGAALGLAVALGGTPVALAHGGRVPDLPPDAANLALGWSGDPLVWLPALVALLLWRTAVRRINRTHPATPVPAWRTWAWVAGVAVVVIALDSGIERYDTTLFWVHMIQHMLLTLVAPPLLLLAAPITVLLRAVSPETRRRRILPLLHARAVRLLSFPIVAWVVFAAVMWGSHFSPLFDASLENDWIHRLEHGLFVVAALLFWWPAIGADPSPWRMRPAVRVIYVGLQMPQNTFLALAIYMATSPLYRHYVTTVRSWGPTPLEDQQLAGGIMWIGGDLAFLTVVILLVLVWMRDEERRTVGEDRRLAAAEAAIRERSARLASRRAAEAGERGAGGS
jgi:cytochrome c oxidase assembly factor CtaG